MPTRAKYIGDYDEVVVPLGEGRFVTVQKDHLLPTEDNHGNPIPASVRDGLLEQEANWTAVKQSTTSTQKKES